MSVTVNNHDTLPLFFDSGQKKNNTLRPALKVRSLLKLSFINDTMKTMQASSLPEERYG
jgi:hypothetical protein